MSAEEVVEVFKRYDKTGKGLLPRALLAELFTRLNPQVFDSDIIDRVLGPEDFFIDYARLVSWAFGTHLSREEFLKKQEPLLTATLSKNEHEK